MGTHVDPDVFDIGAIGMCGPRRVAHWAGKPQGMLLPVRVEEVAKSEGCSAMEQIGV